jgi:hypothetical protein
MDRSMNKLPSGAESWIRKSVGRDRLVWLILGATVAVLLLSYIIRHLPNTLCVLLIIALFVQLKAEWQGDKAPRPPIDRLKIPLFCGTLIALLVLWVLQVFPGAGGGAIVIAGVFMLGAACFLFLSFWMARLYWDATIRIAMLEEIVREKTGTDPRELRRAYLARPPWQQTPLRACLLRQIAPNDFGATPQGATLAVSKEGDATTI